MAQWCCIVLFVSYLIAPCSLEHRHTTPRPRPAELGIYNSQTEIGHNITEILNEFFKSGYDKRIRPNYAGPPVEVGVTMHIICISSVSEVQMDFTSDFYFRQAWRDPRLAFKPRPGIEALFVGAEVAERIWNPDTFFANEKSAQFHLATTPNTFIRIGVNGDVLRSTRLTVTSACAMNLQYFPMDRQMCTIEVESYGYSMADIMYKWSKEKAVGMSEVVELPQFNIQGLKQRSKVEILSTGNYSRLVCEIEFVRSMGYYLIQIYIPASLIVIISWVSFWLHRNASPARVQLGVTTVLTMTTLMSSTNAALPKISYIKSIDVFLGTCFVMVFASLLEYATVGYMGKRIAMRKSRIQQIAKMKIAHRTLQSAEMGNAVGHQTHLPSQHHTICITNEHATHSSMRNSISHAPEVRYRLVGNATTAAGGPSEAAGPSGPDRGRASVDYTRRKLSMAQMMDSEDNEDGGGREGERTSSSPPPPMPGNKNLNTLFGVSPSDIDKYSRVVFPVCFLCFNLMYWIIYMHISEFLTEEFEE